MSMHVITASAGSGKTYTLTKLLSERLTTPSSGRSVPLRASEIIATTFTVRAAADLIDKTQNRLLEDGNTDAAAEIGTALIGTIHSVAGQIATDYAIDAGHSPDVRVLNETEATAAFNIAIDSIVAEAETEHRNLLFRMGHHGRPEDPSRGYNGPVAWSKLVKKIAEEARENNLGEEDLRNSAEDSVREFLAALPETTPDGRQEWRDLFAEDVEELRDALRIANHEPPKGAHEPRVTIPEGSIDNIAGSFGALEHFLRALDRRATSDDPFTGVEWSRWIKIAKASYPKVPGGKTPGKYAVDLFKQSSAELVSRELLSNEAFQDDVAILIRLVFDTAIASLEAYDKHKKLLGVMDFVDQQVRALDLLRSNERVRGAIASRYRLLAVDEFQDSSPIQLAIFMELAVLVDEVIWVGDRKQAIYGFRGADSELMNNVFAGLIAGTSDLGTATTENLGESWRSTDPPLELSNTIFTSVFADQPENEVVLSVPSARQSKRAFGGRELWVPQEVDKRKNRLAETISEGVADFLSRVPELPDRLVRAGDIAVLMRTHDQVKDVVEALRAKGVPASGSKIDLLATREGQFVMSGLGAIAGAQDTVALTGLVTLINDHRAHSTWFEDASKVQDRSERMKYPSTWWQDPTLERLADLRDRGSDYAPTELVLAVIDALDLHQRIKGWTLPETRLANLESLRQIAGEYEDVARESRTPVTPSGLADYLAEVAGKFEHGTSHHSVQVTTMHQSKGLQWPVVVVGVPAAKDHGHQEISVTKASNFDASQPLADRSILFLPRLLKHYSPLKMRLVETAHVQSATDSYKSEEARLLYVASTRAEYYSVLAFGNATGENNQLDDSVGCKLLSWDMPSADVASGARADCDGVLKVADLRSASSGLAAEEENWLELPIRIGTYSAADGTAWSESQSDICSSYAFTDIPRRDVGPNEVGLPASISPSSVSSVGIEAEVTVVADLGEPLVSGGGRNWDRIGDVVHAYLALPLQYLSDEAAYAAAERITNRWGTSGVLSPEILMEAGLRWVKWIKVNFPEAEVFTEQPIAWRNDRWQVGEGWIDCRIQLSDGSHVLVDHKAYPGNDSLQHVMENYLGQLHAYSQATEYARGLGPERVLVHLPLKSKVLEMRLGRQQ